MSKARILLVEDDEQVANATRKILADLGYDIASTAKTGEEAIRLAGSDQPDLILMDIGLGEAMDGIEAAGRIRSSQDAAVVFLTATEDEPTLSRARASEPFGFITKPFKRAGLHATIEIALAQHKSRKRSEAAMQEAHDRFRAQHEHRLTGVFQANENGEILQANRALVNLLGYESLEDLLAAFKSGDRRIHSGAHAGRPFAVSGNESNAEGPFELQTYRKDGSTISVSGSVKTIRDSSGKVLCYEGSLLSRRDEGAAEQPLRATRPS